MTTALLIRNPVARHPLSDEALASVLSVARAAGWQIDTVATDGAGAATALARDAAQARIDVVVVHGGDGTVNEAINGLAGTRTALAVLRGGTANVWAKETHCAKDPVASMRGVVSGVRRRVDVGRANGRYFLLMAGIGLDAAIVARMNPAWKRRLGALAYIVAGVAATFRWRTHDIRLTIDGTEYETPMYWMLIGNTRSYGGVARITHRALIDDGRFEVALLKRGGPLRMLESLGRLLVGRHLRGGNVRYARATTVDVSTPDLPVQLDGEDIGTTPLRFEIVPLGLEVIVPPDLDSPLFSLPADQA
jgi:YegS/Rv2252/BmrU family lipid kinase